jgi:hypothetical protein
MLNNKFVLITRYSIYLNFILIFEQKYLDCGFRYDTGTKYSQIMIRILRQSYRNRRIRNTGYMSQDGPRTIGTGTLAGAALKRNVGCCTLVPPKFRFILDVDVTLGTNPARGVAPVWNHHHKHKRHNLTDISQEAAEFL